MALRSGSKTDLRIVVALLSIPGVAKKPRDLSSFLGFFWWLFVIFLVLFGAFSGFSGFFVWCLFDVYLPVFFSRLFGGLFRNQG